MKSVSNMVRDVYSLLSIPEVKSQITGEIWEDKLHSKAKPFINIIVQGITLTNASIQLGSVHVKVSAPNIELKYQDVGDGGFPDKTTLDRVCNLITPLLDNIYGRTFQTYVEEPANLMEDADGNWYSRIVLSYQSVQENYENI